MVTIYKTVRINRQEPGLPTVPALPKPHLPVLLPLLAERMALTVLQGRSQKCPTACLENRRA